MDGSFLSHSDVIAASRQFVCARLITYEDADEGLFLKQMCRTRSGELENSAFCILAPDGKTKLVNAGREMNRDYSSAKGMADDMARIMAGYHPKASIGGLPLTADVRIGLDVASSDLQLFVVVVSKDAEKRKTWEAALAKLAWSDEFVGRFVYASTYEPKDLSIIEGVRDSSSLLVIQPDKFGVKGKTLAQTADIKDISATLSAGARAFVREQKGFQSHIREGHDKGIFWTTKIPVTDPGELMARERNRGQ
jgi:hypothetical protein